MFSFWQQDKTCHKEGDGGSEESHQEPPLAFQVSTLLEIMPNLYVYVDLPWLHHAGVVWRFIVSER